MQGALVTIGAVIAMFLGVYFMVRALVRYTQAEKIYCPVEHQKFNAILERRADATWSRGKVINVKACSHFDDPEKITCDKACIEKSHKPLVQLPIS